MRTMFSAAILASALFLASCNSVADAYAQRGFGTVRHYSQQPPVVWATLQESVRELKIDGYVTVRDVGRLHLVIQTPTGWTSNGEITTLWVEPSGDGSMVEIVCITHRSPALPPVIKWDQKIHNALSTKLGPAGTQRPAIR